MKTLFLKSYKYVSLVILSLMTLYSCNDDDAAYQATAPSVEFVSASVDSNGQPINPLTPTTIGYANNTYVIQGKGFASLKHIYFNEKESYFNPNLVTDTHIIVTINTDTPYENGNNKLKIVTGVGTIEHDFVVAPPAPVFTSFDPINAADGEEVTLYGNYFVNPTVKVGDAEAEIISRSLTEMKIKLPANSQGKKITVTTLSGNNTWGTAVGTAIFDDKFYAPWDFEAWNNHTYVTDHSAAFQGNVFIKKEIDGWGNIQSNTVYDDEAVAKYTGIKFAVRSDDDGKLQLIFNEKWDDMEARQFTTSKDWKEVRFTWSQLDNPITIQSIKFKEFTGNKHNYYFDNITYTTD